MEIVEHVKRSIELAEKNQSKITDDIISYTGYSGTKTRHFYNNICSLPNANYLEIGTWYGSSSISAIYKNNIHATFIDNWSEFNGNKDILIGALNLYKGDSTCTLIEGNSTTLNTSSLPMFDIYLYDGGHTYHEHYTAITRYMNKLKNNCIIMIDDWNWDVVRSATMQAFADMNVKFLFSKEIILPEEERAGMPDHLGKNTWWNGIGIFVIDKTN